MSKFILGLHGSFENAPAKGVHDANYCLADLRQQKVLALVEMEKLSGVRHDGRLNQELLLAELAPFHKTTMHITSSHFTTYGNSSPREFPLFREIDRIDKSNLRFCFQEELSLFDTKFPHFVYLHELAHVFTAYMYRKHDHQKFLGLVIEGSGSFAQNSLFLIDNFRAQLLAYNLPILSGNFFHQWLSKLVFEAQREDYKTRSATPGKVMSLAAYGDSERFRELLLNAMHQYKIGGYINFRDKFCPAIENMNLSWKDRVDLCATGQKLFEDLIIEQALEICEKYGNLPLYYAGGCALSIKTNSRLRGIFDDIIIPPNCGDDGLALGLVAAHAFLEHHTLLRPFDHCSRLLTTSHNEININGHLSPEDIEKVARWLAAGEIVAFVQGLPEIGPRALCQRSILAHPAISGMREILNHVKGREYFRPVAPIVLDSYGEEIFHEYFFSPYMLYNFSVKPERTDFISEAIHEDGSTRVQSIPDDDSDIAKLLRDFSRITNNPPVLLNTSLNSQGQPIAATVAQVRNELIKLKIKHLVLGDRALIIDSQEE